MSNIEPQIQRFLENYEFFSRINKNEYVILSGIYHLSICHKNHYFEDYFELELIIDTTTKTNPIVYEKRRIDNFHHKFTNGSLCLGIPMEISIFLRKNKYDLVQFFSEYVDTYLYGYLYHEAYNIMPFGERSHGSEGYIEYFRDIFGLSTNDKLLEFLRYLSNNFEYKGHHMCPCGSNKKIRDCHKEVLFHYFNEKNEVVLIEIKKYLERNKNVKSNNNTRSQK